MIPEGFDKSISTGLAIGSAALAFWAHRRELKKEKRRISEEAQQQYAEKELKAYAAQRDFGHIQRDLDQLKINTAHLSKEADERLDRLEQKIEKFSGSLEVVMSLIKDRQA